MYEAEFHITADDLTASRKRYYRAYLKGNRTRRGVIRGTLIMLALGLLSIWPFGLRNGLIITAAVLAYWALFYGLMLYVTYLRLPSQSRRLFKQHKALHEMHRVTWSASGITFTVPSSESRFAWDDFIGVIEDKDYILLRQTEMMFNLVPKRALTAEQVADLMAHANRPGHEPL